MEGKEDSEVEDYALFQFILLVGCERPCKTHRYSLPPEGKELCVFSVPTWGRGRGNRVTVKLSETRSELKVIHLWAFGVTSLASYKNYLKTQII